MKTPANANPIMAPLDNRWGGANPEKVTPVELKLFLEISNIFSKSSRYFRKNDSVNYFLTKLQI